MRISFATLVIAVLIGAASLTRLEAAPVVIAVPDVGFSDSSGEVRDQKSDHQARLQALAEGLRADIARDGKLSSVALSCAGSSCTLDEAGVERLRAQASAAGASFMLVCGVHKMSTLVMAMKVDVFEVDSGRLVASKLLSFRGDNDEGWRRAGAFVAKDVANALVKDGAPAPQ